MTAYRSTAYRILSPGKKRRETWEFVSPVGMSERFSLANLVSLMCCFTITPFYLYIYICIYLLLKKKSIFTTQIIQFHGQKVDNLLTC